MMNINQSGSLSVNFKNFFSKVLTAVADADYCFISVEFGSYGRLSYFDVLQNSIFGKLLESNKLNISDPRFLPSDAQRLSMPFALVSNKEFF
jgi:hypothetical protein